MSIVFSFTGSKSELTNTHFPPLTLNGAYVCGLIDFHAFNSIPNIDGKNNVFHIGNHKIKIPTGTYEIDDIAEYVTEKLKSLDSRAVLNIVANNNTMKAEIYTNRDIHFETKNSIAPLLGFDRELLQKGKETTNKDEILLLKSSSSGDEILLFKSNRVIDIMSVNMIRIQCNIISSSYINSKLVHNLHEFPIDVEPGYKIIERPSNVIYLPVTADEINTITIRIEDERGELINFRGETITVRIHLKPA